MQGKAEDAGGLSPVKDDNTAMRTLYLRTFARNSDDCYRLELRRIYLFTEHRSSSLGSVSEKPPPRWTPQGAAPSKGVQNHGFWRLFGYFLAVQKVTAGCGAA